MVYFFSQELYLRVFSAIILMLVVFPVIVLGGGLFQIMVMIFVALMSYEWANLTTLSKDKNEKTSTNNKLFWNIIGVLYIVIPAWCLINIRFSDHGLEKILYIVGIVSVTDIASYVFGRSIGGMKLFPIVSPNKTAVGFIGGGIFAFITGVLLGRVLLQDTMFIYFSSLLIVVLSQIGDILESKVKRIFQVKDSGDIIPGHGGIIDRFDSYILVLPVMNLYLV